MNSHLHPIFQEALAPFASPATRSFRVELKRGSIVQESFEVQGTDSMAVASEFRSLVSPGQILRVTAIESATEYAQRRARENDAQARRLDLQMRDAGLLR